MSDISKIINDSIASVVSEGAIHKLAAVNAIANSGVMGDIKKKIKEIKDDMASGKAAEIVYDKLHPEKTDVGFEVAKALAKVRQEHEKELAKVRQEHENMGVGEHLAKAGKKAGAAIKERGEEAVQKAGAAIKERGEEAVQAVKDHPGLAAATAAGLAAAVGGLAAVKRMRKAAKK